MALADLAVLGLLLRFFYLLLFRRSIPREADRLLLWGIAFIGGVLLYDVAVTTGSGVAVGLTVLVLVAAGAADLLTRRSDAR